jgi:hypothetical protein
MTKCLPIIFVCLLFSLSFAFAEEAATPANETEIILKVVENALGKGVKVVRTDNPEKSPVEGWMQTRVWIESVYGETPVLFYSAEDGKFIFAGSIFDSSGENLTRKDVGETRARFIEMEKMDLTKNYLIGSQNAAVKAVLWLGVDALSKEIFEAFYNLYRKNEDNVALYIKFYPRSRPDREKMMALTCYKNQALVKGLGVIYDAHPDWGSKEDLEAFRKAGDLDACNEEQVARDLRIAAQLQLPPHPVAFVDGHMLIERVTKENIVKLAGTELK